MINFNEFKFNFAMLLKEVASRNIELKLVGSTNIVEARLGSHIEYFVDYITRLTPAVYLSILQDKFYSKEFVREKGFSVTPGYVFQASEFDHALEYARQLGYPVVIKPVNAGHGDFVFAYLQDEEEFTQAFQRIAQYSHGRDILVEKHFLGDDYRFLVIGEEEVAVAKRTPPRVTGDGHSTIQELIARENHQRMNPRTTCLCEIYIKDEEGKRALRHQGFTEESVPAAGDIVKLRYHANVAWGAECENALSQVHPSYLELARTIHRSFPGNHFTCVDILVQDVSVPVTPDNYAFCEFNVDPGFSLHHMPSKGKPHLVLKSIVDLIFPETAHDQKRYSDN